jgi:hypothetical protein
LALSATLAFAAPLQAHPDFSGVWSVSAIRPAPAQGAANSLPPSDLTITQSAAQLSVSRTAFDTVITAAYDLTGRESTNKSGAMTRITKARWEGARLVIEGKASQVTSQGYAAWTTKETYSFNAEHRLLIETEYKSDDGPVTHSVQELIRKKAK